jgi:hypothetical protein
MLKNILIYRYITPFNISNADYNFLFFTYKNKKLKYFYVSYKIHNLIYYKHGTHKEY